MSGWERQRSLTDAHHRQPERDCEDFGIVPPYNRPRASELSVQELDAAKEAYLRGDVTACLNIMTYQKPPPPAIARQRMACAGSQFGVQRLGVTSSPRSYAQQPRPPSTSLSGTNRGRHMFSRPRSSVANSLNAPGMPWGPCTDITGDPNTLGMPSRSTPHGSQQRCDTGRETTPGDFESSDPVARSGLLTDLRGLTLTSSLPESREPVLRNGKFVEG
jgi:hypothetical protein